jgi:hypothetical protein
VFRDETQTRNLWVVRCSRYVTDSLDIAKFKKNFFFRLDKSTDRATKWYCISNTAFEEKWEINSALKVDKLVAPLLRKWLLNLLVHLPESSSLSTPIQHGSHPLKPAPHISLRIHE